MSPLYPHDLEQKVINAVKELMAADFNTVAEVIKNIDRIWDTSVDEKKESAAGKARFILHTVIMGAI